jgi:putative ABC transport system permease protein
VTLHGFALKNCLRNKKRLALTIGSLAFSLFLVVSLLNFLVLLEGPTSDDSALRLAVRRSSSLTDSMPLAHLDRIRAVPGVKAAMPFTWFQGIFGDDMRNFFASFSVDPQVVFTMFGEIVLSEQERLAFQRERSACIVGRFTANRFGWRLGDRVKLVSQIHFTPEGEPVELDLVIRGIFSVTQQGLDENLFFHNDYFEQANGRQGYVGTFWVKVGSVDDIPMVSSAIDSKFRNTAHETRTETEKAFAAAFVSMIGNLRFLFGSISAVVIGTIILVVGSTMAMSIRERSAEIATLKTLGFTRRGILALLMGESVGISFIGGVVGVGGAVLFYSTVNLAKATGGVIQRFDLEPRAIMMGMILALLIGIVSAAVPAWNASRQTVLDGLRQLN